MRSDASLAIALLAAARHDSDSAEQCCRLLLDRAVASDAWRRARQTALARAGLTETGFAVLVVLWRRSPPPQGRGALAAAAELSPACAADALLRLEVSGLVERELRHGRRAFWQLTTAGLRQVAAGLDCYVQAVKSVTRQLSAAEIGAAMTVAGKIRDGAAELERSVNDGA
ncbi:MAG: MarR family winged helix-turn-helix transcriptional regulator [Gammaproteobacteria bacterium]